MTESEYEKDYNDRISRILKMHEKPPYVREKVKYKPLTKDEIRMFQNMGCKVTIIDNSAQNKLF